MQDLKNKILKIDIQPSETR